MNNMSKIALAVACLCIPMAGTCAYSSSTTSSKPTMAKVQPSSKPTLDLAGLGAGTVYMSKTMPKGGSKAFADASGNYYVHVANDGTATAVSASGRGKTKLKDFRTSGFTRTSNYTSR